MEAVKEGYLGVRTELTSRGSGPLLEILVACSALALAKVEVDFDVIDILTHWDSD